MTRQKTLSVIHLRSFTFVTRGRSPRGGFAAPMMPQLLSTYFLQGLHG